jgi:hypothetical protein
LLSFADGGTTTGKSLVQRVTPQSLKTTFRNDELSVSYILVAEVSDLVVRDVVSSMISGFRSDVDEISALLGYNAASSGNPLPIIRDNVSVPSSRVKKSSEASLDFLTLEDGTDTLYRNFGKGLPLDAA